MVHDILRNSQFLLPLVNTSKTKSLSPSLMAVVCLGLIACALVQDLFFPKEPTSTVGWIIIKGIGFFLPVLLGIILCTGKRWAMMAGVAYGTIGLALDIATFVQSVTGETDTAGYLLLVGISGILNFLLILLGGRGIFSKQMGM